MTILFLDPVGGIAGDMLMAALLDLGAPREALDRGLAALAPLGFHLDVKKDYRSGIAGTHVDVIVEAPQPPERAWREIRELLERAALPQGAKAMALRAFEKLAVAEAAVHAKSVEDVHFHEVGAVDSIVDFVGGALLIDALGAVRRCALPPPSGSGVTDSAHGMIPIPGPATLEVMKGRRMRPSGPGERTTPTGAALLTALFDEVDAMPELGVERVGYGLGTKTWADAPNFVRAVLGREPSQREGAYVLEANLDDLTPQLVAAAMDACFAAGALDAWASPALMKKGRPAQILGALASAATRDAVATAILRTTSTLGVRVTRVERDVLERRLDTVATPYGDVRVKVALRAGEAWHANPEYDDCAARAAERGVPVQEVHAAALAAWRTR